ncbi:MAG TPA: LuxR C-terminal-related transcriptional regulator [Jiangellales bacterium]|nr:LuxR C-terminal-related transcriptional regulator [Jiangellales bacterium]
MAVTWPLVGRRAELEFIEKRLAGDYGGVALAGPPGVGKSRLAAESLALAKSRGMNPLLAVGTAAAAAIPFGPLAHLLPVRLPAAPGRENVLRLVGDALLDQVGGQGRPVMGVDDAHLLDDHSAALLHHLVLHRRLLLVMTLRIGELTPGPVVDLWKDEHCALLELRPLSKHETSELLELALDGPVAGSTVHRLWQLTAGNPLFLRELVLGALEDGGLAQSEGLWRWRGGFPGQARIREVLGARLDGVTGSERDALAVVALGEPLDATILRRLAVESPVRRLVRRGLLVEGSETGRIAVRPSHPLYGELLRDTVSPSRARAIRLKLADAMEEAGSAGPEDDLRIATWRMEAGATGRPELFAAAAEQALALTDYGLAERLAEAAIRAGAGFNASFTLARAMVGKARFAAAEDILSSLDAVAATDTQRTAAALTRVQNLDWNLGLPDDALEVITAVERTVTDPAAKAEMAAARAFHLMLGGRFAESIGVAMKVLEDGPTSPATLYALSAAWADLVYTGHPEEAMALVGRHLDRVRPMLASEPTGPVAVLTFYAVARYFAGQLGQAEAEVESAHRDAMDHGADWVAGFIGGCLGLLLRAQGRARSATRLLKEAVVLLRDANVGGQLGAIQAELAQSLALEGNAEAAEQAFKDAEAARLMGEGWAEGWLLLVRAWIAVARGEISRGAAIAIETAETLGAMGWRSQQAIALHDAARLGKARTVAEPLAQVAAQCDGQLIPAFARHARALAIRNPASLAGVSVEFEQMGALLLAAEAAAEASRCYESAGHRREARDAAARALDLARQCEGARTPALADLTEPLPLTRREREVARLAAQGLSNQEIADRLVVSVRTVANHLHSTYGKLAIEGRSDLRTITGLWSSGSGDRSESV